MAYSKATSPQKTEERNVEEVEETKATSKRNFWIIAAGAGIVVIWILAYTNILFRVFDQPLAEAIHERVNQSVFIITIIYLIALIAVFKLQDLLRQRDIREKQAILLVSPHTQLETIREIALKHYDLRLGNCINIKSDPALGEASSVPTIRYFLFDIMKGNKVTGISKWKQSYVKEVVTELCDADWFGRESNARHWTDENKLDPTRKLEESSAKKKRKHFSNIKSADEEEESLTE